MAGYTASVTLHGAAPRFVAMSERAGRPRPSGFRTKADPGPEDELAGAIAPIDLVGRPLDAVIGDWLASIGESWSQLTFYVFDPQSWR